MIFINVDVYRFNHDTQGYKSRCKICQEKYKHILNAYMRFYNENSHNISTYDFVICDMCFYKRIKDGNPVALKSILAMDRMRNTKAKRLSSNTWHTNYGDIQGAIDKLKEASANHLKARKKNCLIYRKYFNQEVTNG